MACKNGAAFFGTLIHSISREKPLVILTNVLCLVKDGRIARLQSGLSEEEAKSQASQSCEDIQLHIMRRGQFLMPGFVDTHIHAPQYVNVGLGYNLELLDWLKQYTFPAEEKFSDSNYANEVYSKVVKKSLRNGTTTACYFATIHTESTLVLAENMDNYGQRGYVGKVNMDDANYCPPGYYEDTAKSLSETREFVQKMNSRYKKKGLLTPCITPRFALSCTSELMTGLAKIAKEFGDLPIQTHMSENKFEIKEVLKKFEVDNMQEYVQVYENSGLLTDKTILAHCVHSNDIELGIIKQYGCGIAHCPNSNTSLSSGDINVKHALTSGVKVGLGTDISGGYSIAIHDGVRKAVEVSKHVAMHSKSAKTVNHEDAFYLATLGGAEVMGLQDKIGNFVVGKDFDALLIDTDCEDSPFDIFDIQQETELLQKFLYCGDDRNITQVYVAGRRVKYENIIG